MISAHIYALIFSNKKCKYQKLKHLKNFLKTSALWNTWLTYSGLGNIVMHTVFARLQAAAYKVFFRHFVRLIIKGGLHLIKKEQ